MKDKKFSWQKFNNLLVSNNIYDAEDYRISNMPNKIYKFISLDKDIDSIKLNKKNNMNFIKLNTLENNLLWLSKFSKLNDPFEYQGVYFDQETAKIFGYPTNALDYFLKQLKKFFIIASFTIIFNDNMPMWAHYANNHQGFCVEYEVSNPKYLYPISYEEKRIDITKTFCNFYKLTEELRKQTINEDDEVYRKHLLLNIFYSIIKHQKWTYENEFRIVYHDTDLDSIGKTISLKEIGLKINRIYIGYNCDNLHNIELQRIANNLQIEFFQMKLPNSSDYFKLIY